MEAVMGRKMLFKLGQITATPGAVDALRDANQAPQPFLIRLRSGVKIWTLTEADRSATTILLPDEY
jgi:hypothetical protein